jgi:hypothetical protein
VRKILVPLAWKTASNEAVKFDPRSRIRNLVSSDRSPRMREVAGLLRRPFAGGVGGDAAQMHPATAVLDEHQDVQSLQQHSVHVEEVDREDPGSLGVQELPPGRACATGSWIDARGTRDLPDGGLRDRHAEFHHFAVDPAVDERGEPTHALPPRAIRQAVEQRVAQAEPLPVVPTVTATSATWPSSVART